jgi:hypothetical protein
MGRLSSTEKQCRLKSRFSPGFGGGILDPQNRPFPHFRIHQPIKLGFRLPIGNNKAGFPRGKIGNLQFPAIKREIRELMIKNVPLRPVGRNRPKREYARIKS